MQLGCRDLTVGYDGKAILKNINFSVEEGEYLSIREIDIDAYPAPASTAIKWRSDIGKWSEQRRDRVSAATDCHPERLPGIRERNCSLRMSEPLWAETIL